MNKSYAAKQEEMLANQKRCQRRQNYLKIRQDSLKIRQEDFRGLPKPPARLAKVPKGTPASKSWHVERHQVMEQTFEALTEDGGPRLVGLVGDSGSGKTTAASDIVRSTEVREAFHDGIVWLSVNKGANKRLPSLMAQLARMVFETIGGSVGRPPATSDDGAAYIKQRMEKGHVGKGLKCLVVADNVWEIEVVLKLLGTGMWVLLSTRDEELVNGAQGKGVGVNELSMTDAKSVLRRAAELSSEMDLSDEAVNLIALCGRVAMDLAFVGRWSAVRNRNDRQAWSDAADKVRTEVDKVQAESDSGRVECTHARRRNAILRAGFDDLALGSDDMRVPRLYLSLAVMPDGYAFTVKNAAVLLCNLAPSDEDVKSVGGVLETLERWTVVRLIEETYQMHDAHSSFARESLMDRGDVRRPALGRWVRFISSLDALRSINAFDLKELWLAVKRVGGHAWDESFPYTSAMDGMDESDPLLRQSVCALGRFQEAQEDWEGASNTWRRLLDVEKRHLGPHHAFSLMTFQALADCAGQLGRIAEATEWRTRGREAIRLALARMQLQLDAGEVDGVYDAYVLRNVGVYITRWAPHRRAEFETLLRAYLMTQEAKLGREDLRVAHTLRELGVSLRITGRLEEAEEILKRSVAIETTVDRDDVEVAIVLHELGVCVRDAGRLEEAQKVLRRSLAIKEAKLGREHHQVANTLRSIGECVRQAGRLAEAEELLRRCLVIEEAKLGREDLRLAYTLHSLGICVRQTGRLEVAEECLRRCVVIWEAKLGRQDLQVAYTLHQLGVCVRQAGRLEEAEEMLRRCQVIWETKLGQDNLQMAYTMRELGICMQDAGRLEEAEGLLRRCLVISEAKLGRQDLQVAYTLHKMGVCVRQAGRLKEAEELLRRCLVIQEAKLGRKDLQVAYTLHELGTYVRQAGRLEEAEELLRRCCVVWEAKLGGEALHVAHTLHQLGVCVRQVGRLEEAEKLLRRCLVIEVKFAREDVGMACTLYELGLCVRFSGRLEEAEELLRRCLVIEETNLGREDLGVAITLHELSVCARGAGRLEEAEELLRRCLTIRESKLR